MPIYEYECQSCREVLEIWQSLSEAPVTSCPSCNGLMKKIISMSSFQLKGGGWFADGYSSNAAPAKGAAASSTPAKSGSAPTPAPSCPKAKKPCGKC